MPAVLDYEPIIRKLLEKSEEGRLAWEKRNWPFVCTIDGQYTFEVARDGDTYSLTMKDSMGEDIFSVSREQEVVYREPKDKELLGMLRDLYELARRKALNVDEKLATVSALLDCV